MTMNAQMQPAEPVGAVTPLDAEIEIPDTAFRDAIPRLSRGEELITRIFAVVAWLYGLYWITWRWSSSLNHNALIFSIVLIVAETYGLINSFFLIATVWKLKYRDSPPAPKALKVDVFITSFDEPLEVLRRTAIGARAIKYPHRTFMLDDGKRDEVKAMETSMRKPATSTTRSRLRAASSSYSSTRTTFLYPISSTVCWAISETRESRSCSRRRISTTPIHSHTS